MKIRIFYIILAIAVFVGCKKNDGPVPVTLERIPEPQLDKNGGSPAIDALNLQDFHGKFDVGLFFKSDVPPSKMDIVVRKNGDNSSAKLFKADIATFPTTLEIDESDFVSLFGDATVLGDSYDIGADVYTKSGKKYQAFPTVGAGYGSSIAAQPGATPVINYTAICQYHPEIYEGNFVVITDEFADLSPGDVVVLTRVDDTHFSYIYPSGVNPKPIIVSVDPGTNVLSIAKQQFGDYFSWQPAYTHPNAATSSNALNIVSPCDQEWGAVVNYTVDQGGFGGYYLQMKKQ